MVGLVMAQGSVQAATIEVNTDQDGDINTDTFCTLREAITSVNEDSTSPGGTATGCTADGAFGSDTITFSAGLENSTVTLSNGELYVEPGNILTIEGDGITVNGNNASRVFYANSATVTIDNMTITGGSAVIGGGLRAKGSSTVNLNNSTVSGNSAYFGGGAYTHSSSVSLSNSTVSGNSATYGGGVMASWSSSASLSNSTVSDNSVSKNGGGVIALFSSSASLSNSTVSGNSASISGGGMWAYYSSINLSNSIVANSPRGGDCFVSTSTITSDSASIIEDGTCDTSARTGDPGLFPLANNGGPTLTHAIKANSIARDSAIGNCPFNDQRNRPRPNGACDVGAFELATVQVTTLADETSNNGQCSLREAIGSLESKLPVNGCSVSDGNGLITPPSIIFADNLDNGTITLSNGQFEVDNSVTIDASTLSDGITANGNNASRVFYANSATLSIDNMTITGGSTSVGGGGVRAYGSIVSLNDSTVSGNSAIFGGGMYAYGSIVSLKDSTASDNSAFRGGGVFVSGSTASLSNSTVSGNFASNDGGGVSVLTSSSLILTNSTVSGNSAPSGGGIIAANTSTTNLSNSTVSGNSASYGSGVYAVFGASVSLSNSIVANSFGSDDCDLELATVTSDSASIIEDDGCATDARTGDPGILPLANNGGPTKTHALRSNSPARNTGILGTCTEIDQRGRIRDDGDGACDVGAFEFDSAGFIVIPLGNGKAAVIPN